MIPKKIAKFGYVETRYESEKKTERVPSILLATY
jgi:hypothetical protein